MEVVCIDYKSGALKCRRNLGNKIISLGFIIHKYALSIEKVCTSSLMLLYIFTSSLT